jgi:hypothetical protein
MTIPPFDWPLLLFTAAIALVWALLEIQIEGPHGWAKNLPTWRIKKHPRLDFLCGGTDITGYHVYAFGGILLFFHLPFVWNASWSWRGEVHIIGAFTLFWVMEDYLWFVLNPHFGWKSLTPENIPWQRWWVGKLPVNYYIAVVAGTALFLVR